MRPGCTPYDPSDTTPMLVHVPAGVPSTQSRTWLHTALAADSALDRPRAYKGSGGR